MKRLILTAIAGFALLGAGIAIAHGVDANSVKQVSANLTLGTASNVHTETCTGADGTYTRTHGRWTGAATGDPTLSGNATLDADILVNPAGDGTISGKLRIDGANHTDAHVDGVIAAGGNFAGLAQGHGSAPWNRLIGNISGNYSSASGITAKLGGATAGGNAVVLTDGACKKPEPAPKPHAETLEAHGAVTIGANNATVAVAGVTCNVPASLTADVAKRHTGDQVEIKCTSSAGVNTLTRIEGKGKH